MKNVPNNYNFLVFPFYLTINTTYIATRSGFLLLFTDADRDVRAAGAGNPNAVLFYFKPNFDGRSL
jgi:hypothetical protein